MTRYEVVEKFVSINGEGISAGQPAVFIRFKGCNLSCSFCDTMWANEHNADCTLMCAEEIYDYIKKTGIKRVTLTGGEPLLVSDIETLVDLLLCDNGLHVEIETNGSIDISALTKINRQLTITMDYKLPSSSMETKMLVSNISHLRKCDTIKFVVGNEVDLVRAKHIIDKFDLTRKCYIYISPVFGKIELIKIVEFMINNRMNDVTMQLQMHKIIWEPNLKGV